MASETAVDVKQAVYIAQAYLKDLFPTGETVQLEEVEPLENGGWHVTLSFERQGGDPLSIGRMIALQNGSERRVYKLVTVDPAGVPLSVKIRS